jgi:FemAB-related protein (PEP-CTERM system-associated)
VTSASTRSEARAPAADEGETDTPELEIRLSEPADDDERDALVRTLDGATFFHLSGWRKVVELVLGHRPHDLLACDGGRIVGVLPLMLSRKPLGLGRPALISVPFGVYGGPAAERVEISKALVRDAMRRTEASGYARLELRCVEDPGLELTGSDLYATFVEELPKEPEQALQKMPKKARAEARKARDRHGLRLVEGIWYMDDLYRLYHENKRALGSPGVPHGMFHHLRKQFGDDVRVHLVQKGSRPLAAVMSFLWRDTLMAYYSGTAPGADREFSASNFMYMALRQWAIENGYRRFDFGRSRKDAGAFKFKVHQGFEPRDLHYRFHLVGDKHLPSFNPSNPRTKVLRDAWTRLPAAVTRRLSKSLIRYLP